MNIIEKKFEKIIKDLQKQELSPIDVQKINQFVEKWEFTKNLYDEVMYEIRNDTDSWTTKELQKEKVLLQSNLMKKVNLFKSSLKKSKLKSK
jgi:hypothetical protein